MEKKEDMLNIKEKPFLGHETQNYPGTEFYMLSP